MVKMIMKHIFRENKRKMAQLYFINMGTMNSGKTVIEVPECCTHNYEEQARQDVSQYDLGNR